MAWAKDAAGGNKYKVIYWELPKGKRSWVRHTDICFARVNWDTTARVRYLSETFDLAEGAAEFWASFLARVLPTDLTYSHTKVGKKPHLLWEFPIDTTFKGEMTKLSLMRMTDEGAGVTNALYEACKDQPKLTDDQIMETWWQIHHDIAQKTGTFKDVCYCKQLVKSGQDGLPLGHGPIFIGRTEGADYGANNRRPITIKNLRENFAKGKTSVNHYFS